MIMRCKVLQRKLPGSRRIERTVFENRLPTASVYFLTPDEETGGVGKVDVSRFGVEVDGPRVDQVLDRLHVLVAGLDVHVQASDDSGTALPVEQEQIVFGLCDFKRDRQTELKQTNKQNRINCSRSPKRNPTLNSLAVCIFFSRFFSSL